MPDSFNRFQFNRFRLPSALIQHAELRVGAKTELVARLAPSAEQLRRIDLHAEVVADFRDGERSQPLIHGVVVRTDPTADSYVVRCSDHLRLLEEVGVAGAFGPGLKHLEVIYYIAASVVRDRVDPANFQLHDGTRLSDQQWLFDPR